MQDEMELMNRRCFLRLSGSGTAVAAANTLLPTFIFGEEKQPELTDRAKPGDPIVLRSSHLELILDRTDGLPFSYRLLQGGSTLRGEDLGKQVSVILCQKAP